VPREGLNLSIVKGVSPGDWRGVKVAYGLEIEEPVDLDVDPTGLDVEASDAWVDLVDELGCDCSKVGGYPLWANAPIDVSEAVGRPLHFHHRLSDDLVEYRLGDGGVIFVFVNEDGAQGEGAGAACWQVTGGGAERTHSMWGRDRDRDADEFKGGIF